MHDLERFIRRKDDFDVTIKAVLAHYQFETIHPFVSGNGRVGRILSYILLANGKVLMRPIACLSYYLNLDKIEYIDRIKSLQGRRDYGQWIKFYIKSIIFAAEDALEKIGSWLRVREKHLAKIDQGNSPIKALKKVYSIIERYPIFDVNIVAEKTGISYNTAASALKVLIKLKIIEQSNNMMRNRNYAYMEFLDCFLGEDMLWQLDNNAKKIIMAE